MVKKCHFRRMKIKWLYLIVLSLVWGSSFILMKKALLGLSPIEIGAFRILITALFLFIIGAKRLKEINKAQWKYIFITAFLGTFFPAFFFALAIENIDSSIAAVLNSLTPLNTLITGVLFFGFVFRPKALIGVLLGLAGTLILILKGASLNPGQNYWFALYILASTLGYAFNVNILKRYLSGLNAFSITLGNFMVLIIPAFGVLAYIDFFENFELGTTQIASFGYLTVLAVLGTGVAKVIFNRLVQIASPVFASSVTYLIPIIALFWGFLDGEHLVLEQLAGALVILLGVYITGRFNKV